VELVEELRRDEHQRHAKGNCDRHGLKN
jgi:hypothetical protein